MPIEQFANQVKKIGKVAKINPAQIREQLIRRLNPMNRYNIHMMAKLNDTFENIVEALAGAEKFILTQGQASIPPNNQSFHFYQNNHKCLNLCKPILIQMLLDNY